MRITRIVAALLSGAMLILAGQLAVDPPEPHLAEQAQFTEVAAPTTPVAPEPTTPMTPPTPAPTTPTKPKPLMGPATVVIPYEEGLSMSLEFLPRTITVPVGTTVTWHNKSTRDHTVTSDTGLFKGTLLLDEYFRYTFTVRGTFHYHCNFFDMVGTVYVE